MWTRGGAGLGLCLKFHLFQTREVRRPASEPGGDKYERAFIFIFETAFFECVASRPSAGRPSHRSDIAAAVPPPPDSDYEKWPAIICGASPWERSRLQVRPNTLESNSSQDKNALGGSLEINRDVGAFNGCRYVMCGQSKWLPYVISRGVATGCAAKANCYQNPKSCQTNQIAKTGF